MFLPEILNLGKGFRQYFEIVPALTDTLKDEVYRLRHQVYCVDLGFERERPDERETDAYDAQSLHVLIRSVQLGDFIGCTRIVRTRADDRHQPLPFEKSCAATLDRSIVDPAKLPRESIGEISRLAVISRFRKRKGEAQTPQGTADKNFGTWKNPRFPYISAGLFFGVVELARLNGIETLFMLTEPREVSSIGRLIGTRPQVIGGAIEHRGERIPSRINTGRVGKDVNFLVRSLYRTVAEEIAQKR
ncbi:MAG TPA: PEP-CTERM/exosortase system-associated acyltransferase [Burkholderiales bacterium]|nr:PEP-CTERM/exosortase system-associated acyltransferase [Burkholderiales bacterium]